MLLLEPQRAIFLFGSLGLCYLIAGLLTQTILIQQQIAIADYERYLRNQRHSGLVRSYGVVGMTKFLVTMNSTGYGRFGDPREELLCEEVDSTELYLLLTDMAALAESALSENPVKRLVIQVIRI